MPNGRFILRTDAGHAIGMGHLARCLSLAAGLRARGHEVCFAVREVPETVLPLLGEYPVVRIPDRNGWEGEFQALAQCGTDACLVMDLSHASTFARLDGFSDHTRRLAEAFQGLAVVDGLFDNALAECAEVHADLLVVPYAGADPARFKRGGVRCLAGPGYMVFGPDYARARVRQDVPERARCILVTAGGSDPQGMSLAALEACSEACRETGSDMEVRLVVGAGFDPGLRNALEKAAREFPGCAMVGPRASLADDMAWADMAVSASGLTKYELALCGTPAILVSLSPEFAAVNRDFDRAGSSLHLGVFADLEPGALGRAVRQLAGDRAGRLAMARAGQALVDAKGADRVIEALETLIGA